MKNAIREYIELSDDEKKALWDTAIFVFDTNVFLNLYRYSNRLRTQLLEAFDSMHTRVWMPYQVAYEFAKDRCKVILEANKRFDNCQKDIDEFVSGWTRKINLDKEDNDINSLRTFLEKWVNNKKMSFTTFDIHDDSVFLNLLELFNGKTGTPYSSKDKEKIEKEGEERYSKKIPPGYKDAKKEDNKFGDLLVWKEILQYAKSNNVDIIYVTQDKKEDWWNICEGITIGPRVELRKEFYDETNQRFHMYTLTSFLSYYNEHKGISIDKSALDEIEQVDKETLDTYSSKGNSYLPIIDRMISDEMKKTFSPKNKVFRDYIAHSVTDEYLDSLSNIYEKIQEKKSREQLSEKEKEFLLLYQEVSRAGYLEELERIHENNLSD